MLKSLFGRRSSAVAKQTRLLGRIEARLDRIDRLVTRLHRDTEQMKLHTGTVLGAGRAVALLATGRRLHVDPRDRGVGINLLTEGKYEEDEITVFRRYLHPGAVVLDIGANYGIYAINIASDVRPGGKVIGFEPNPHICDLFRASIYLNGLTDIVEARQLGVHHIDGDLRFLINETEPGGARVVSRDAAVPPGSTVIDVPVVRLDDHLSPDLIVDAVKIDVEGHEESVLRGMRRLIGRSPDIVIMMELIYAFFPDDAAFVRFMALLTDELGLTVSRIGIHASVNAATMETLRGTSGTVLLSKHAPAPRPDLTIVPAQLNVSQGATRGASEICWADEDAPSGLGPIANGPYRYLPKGTYRLVVDGDFEGAFTCTLQENFGDLIAQVPIPAGNGCEAVVHLLFDAPQFEIALWTALPGPSRLCLRKAELWKIA